MAFADWDRDGDADIFLEAGGAVPGDRAHNVLFQNPGYGNHWLTVKLVGTRTNRAALGAKIRVDLPGPDGAVASRYRTITAGSSFGGNPLACTVGLGRAATIQTLEVFVAHERTPPDRSTTSRSTVPSRSPRGDQTSAFSMRRQSRRRETCSDRERLLLRRRFRFGLFGRGHPLTLKHDHLGKHSVARLELLGSSAVHSPGAHGERVAVELVYPRYLREFLLIGTGEVDPVEFTWRCRLIDLHLALGPETNALRRVDRRNPPAGRRW